MDDGAVASSTPRSPESFLESGGPWRSFRWMNLPAALKRCEPWYRGFESDELLHVSGPKASWVWHIVSGEVDGQRGPVASQTGLFMSWLDLRPGATFETTISPERGVMLYVVRGEVEVNGVPATTRTMVELSHDSGAGFTSRLGTTRHWCCSVMRRDRRTCRGPWTVRDEHGSGNPRSLHGIPVWEVWAGRGLIEPQRCPILPAR